MPYWAEKIGVPRTLAVEFPFGHTLGQPHNATQQMGIIKQALQVLEAAESAGTIIHAAETWPLPQKESYRAWQPTETAPIIKQLAPAFRQMLRKNRQRKE